MNIQPICQTPSQPPVPPSVTPMEALVEVMTEVMDAGGERLWAPLFEAIFYDIPVERFEKLDNAEDDFTYKVTIDQTYSCRYPNEDRTMFYPREITLRCNTLENRIEFPGNTPDNLTAFYGTKDIFLLGTVTGACQYVEWDERDLVFRQLAITDTIFHPEEVTERDQEDAMNTWKNRPRQGLGY